MASHTGDVPAGGIADQPVLERLVAHAREELQRRVERLLPRPVRDQLDADEEAATPDVADIAAVAQRLLQGGEQIVAVAGAFLHQTVPFDDRLNRDAGGAGGGVAGEGVTGQRGALPLERKSTRLNTSS